mmetsp:Transcript_29640/g.60525  ORF Transcript_29640/g.60525 Transcript_29640/m.60525 type:complete len:246 (+) Transcript_29640:615-1352(+)
MTRTPCTSTISSLWPALPHPSIIFLSGSSKRSTRLNSELSRTHFISSLLPDSPHSAIDLFPDGSTIRSSRLNSESSCSRFTESLLLVSSHSSTVFSFRGSFVCSSIFTTSCINFICLSPDPPLSLFSTVPEVSITRSSRSKSKSKSKSLVFVKSSAISPYRSVLPQSFISVPRETGVEANLTCFDLVCTEALHRFDWGVLRQDFKQLFSHWLLSFASRVENCASFNGTDVLSLIAAFFEIASEFK